MPFKSQAQAGYLWKNHPKIAREFAEKTKKIADLPKHVKDVKPKMK